MRIGLSLTPPGVAVRQLPVLSGIPANAYTNIAGQPYTNAAGQTYTKG